MTRNKVIVWLVLILVLFAIYSDQRFNAKNIDVLRERARSMDGVLPQKAFTTDGCSVFPNVLFGNDFTDICIEHDMKYWKGGSAEDRKVADAVLRESVNKKMSFVGDIMYFGVRVLGHPLVPAPWRWGYGFKYPYKY